MADAGELFNNFFPGPLAKGFIGGFRGRLEEDLCSPLPMGMGAGQSLVNSATTAASPASSTWVVGLAARAVSCHAGAMKVTPNGSPPLDPGTGTDFVFDSAPMSEYVQVDRMGMPAVATALILSARKNAYSDGNVQLDTANTFAFDLIEGLRVFAEPLQDDIAARGLKSCAVRRAT